MKVIDLLNKIANGEEVPKKIRYEGRDMIWCEPCKIYEVAEVEQNELCGTDLYNILDNLNDEVEIIEEDKKIKKIDLSEWAEITYSEDWKMLTYDFNRNCCLFVDKINEIIEYLEGKQ